MKWTNFSSSAKDNSVLYGGYVFDAETNNYYARNRYLQPTMGRWTQRDLAGYVDGANLYGYVESNPLRYVDSNGLCPCAPPLPPFPNEYQRKVQGIYTTVIGVDPRKEQSVAKWIEGAEQIELIKTFGDLAGSGLKGAYGQGAKGAAKGGAKQATEGGVKGAAKEIIKDRVQSKAEDKLTDLAKGGVETDADAKILAVTNLLNAIKEKGGVNVWIAYVYTTCVVDKYINGQPVGHTEDRGPKYVKYSEQTGPSRYDDVFGGLPGLGNPEKPNPAKLAAAIKRIEEVGDQ